MTDTTAPRTAAEYLDRLADVETDIIEAVRSADGVGGLKAFLAYRDIVADEARAEAIEPLLALVRGVETTNHRKMRPLPGEAPCCMACGEDWPCPEYAALAALPESVRVAARKP